MFQILGGLMFVWMYIGCGSRNDKWWYLNQHGIHFTVIATSVIFI